jgi:hypothetical protein
MALPATSELTRDDGRVLRYCLYGPAHGFLAVSHGGSPSSRWKRPGLIEAMERSGLRLLVYDRPGYGGSTRHPRTRGGGTPVKPRPQRKYGSAAAPWRTGRQSPVHPRARPPGGPGRQGGLPPARAAVRGR